MNRTGAQFNRVSGRKEHGAAVTAKVYTLGNSFELTGRDFYEKGRGEEQANAAARSSSLPPAAASRQRQCTATTEGGRWPGGQSASCWSLLRGTSKDAVAAAARHK